MRDLRTLDRDTIDDFRCVVETFLVNSDFTPSELEEVLAGVSLEFARAIGFDNHDIRECILETEMLNIEVLDELGIFLEPTIPAHKHDEEKDCEFTYSELLDLRTILNDMKDSFYIIEDRCSFDDEYEVIISLIKKLNNID